MKNHPHLLREGSACRLIVNKAPFIMLGGELHNSSASSLDYLCPLLDKMVRCGLNTVLAPVCWELIEPEEGKFDWTLVDGMIRAARERGLKLVPLWFGTMKNAMSCYAPEWVKTDTVRFPRAETAPGTPSWTVSPFCEEAIRCDARAFARFMARVREIDAEEQTVVMVQVENETGILNAPRDYSAGATEAFAKPVPRALLALLADRSESVRPELRLAWESNGKRKKGTWLEVFGRDAEEFFMAWHIARFVETVAAAGRRAYDLPLYANAWLINGPGFPPGKYPSGGPVSKLLDVWQVAAPSIDFIAPDIYRMDFRATCADYATQGNPLFIPEARKELSAAANVLYALGRHDAMGFAPFAIEDIPETHPLVETYRALAGMLPLISAAQGTGRMTGFLQEADDESWLADLGGFRFRCRTNAKMADSEVPGAALLIDLGDGQFACLGRSLTFTFMPIDGAAQNAEILALDLGSFENGRWVHGRRLNGDETAHGTGVCLGNALTLCRFKLFGFSVAVPKKGAK
jgi:hypothetical protein